MPSEGTETTELNWCGIDIEVRFTRNWLNGLAHHIEVRAGEPLSITATGYKSRFVTTDTEIELEDVLQFLISWLDDAVASRAWQEMIDKKRQGDLFDL